MTRVSEMATITAAGIDPRDPDSIAARSYMAWHAARNNVGRVEKVTGPRGGVLYSGNLTSVILNMWPHLSHTDKAEELDRFRKEVYGFLRATGNAVNEKRGTHGGDVVWWLTDKWVPPTGTVVLKVTAATAALHKPTATERKLTPKEAGEDREPQPVTTTRVVTTTTTTETEDTYMTTAATVAEPKGGAKIAQAKHREILECIELTVRTHHPQPLTVTEIATDLGINPSTTRSALIELIESGTVFSRTETVEERMVRFGGGLVPSLRATLYSSENPVPQRTEREAVRGIIATAAVRTPNSRLSNDAAVLATMKAHRWERAAHIIKRADVPLGSSTMVLNRLVQNGDLETKLQKKNGQTVRLYRKVPKARPETPPVVSTPPAPVAVDMGASRAKAIAAVDELLRSVAGDVNKQKVDQLKDENGRLRHELVVANQEVTHLKAQLATIRNALGQGA